MLNVTKKDRRQVINWLLGVLSIALGVAVIGVDGDKRIAAFAIVSGLFVMSAP